MEAYVTIMNDTITSECCKIVHYVYRDNLIDTDQWIYGATTEEEYRLGIYKESLKHNLTQCPATTPFANKTSNTCAACST